MKSLTAALSISMLSGICLAEPAPDGPMITLARDRGCLACHAVDSAPGSTPAQGPAWRDVAAHYKSVKGAQQQLTARIMTGSSGSANRSSSYANHWEGKAGGEFMPSHRAAISEVEAARLVAWILALEVDQ